MVTLETGKVYRPVMGRPTEERGKIEGGFLVRFLGLQVVKGEAWYRLGILNLEGWLREETSLSPSLIGAGEGQIFDLIEVPDPTLPVLGRMEKELLDNCEVKGELTLSCTFCMNQESIELDDEMTPEAAAVCLKEQGWRSASSGYFATVGIACPSCMAGETEDGPTDLMEEI
jgi:hypothetical protein